MSIENPTLAHFRHFSSLFTNFPSTFVEKPLQISSFMQNKANLLDDQMNVNKVLTKDYENISNCTLAENKPNTNPIKPNLPDDQMNVNVFLTKDYENISNCTLAENKPNTNPIKPNFKGKKMLLLMTINGRRKSFCYYAECAEDAKIEYVDDSGRYADFHCLRHNTGSLLAANGVHPKVAQILMRHCDINLT